MTKEQLYDLALSEGISDPAVLQLGGRFVLGEWVALGELGLDHTSVILKSQSRGILVLAESHESWADVGVKFVRQQKGTLRSRTAG